MRKSAAFIFLMIMSSHSFGTEERTTSPVPSKACADFEAKIKLNGSYPWQSSETYCNSIPNDFVKFYDDINPLLATVIEDMDYKGTFENSELLMSLADFVELAQKWVPSKAIPWDDVGQILPREFTPPWKQTQYEDLIDAADELYKNIHNLLDKEKREYTQEFNKTFGQNLEGKLEKIKEGNVDEAERLNGNMSYLQQFLERIVIYQVFARYLEAHNGYLIKNKEAITSLLKNHYIMTLQGFERYKDDLNKSWRDLMPADYYLGADVQPTFLKDNPPLDPWRILSAHKKYLSLRQAIDDYHQIPKSNETRLEARISALKNIAQLAASLKHRDNDAPILEEIAIRANLKAQYLKKLIGLKDEATRRLMKIPKGKTNVVNVKQTILRDLDPEKREGHDKLYRNWLEHIKSNPQTPDYFLWLETQDTSSLEKDLRHSYLPKSFKKVHFKDGIGYNEIFRERESGHVMDGEYVYNIDETGDLYILPAHSRLNKFYESSKRLVKEIQRKSHRKQTRELNHDTVLGGENILSAGMITFKNGRIHSIDTNSGHYFPKMIQNLQPALALLLQKHPSAISDKTIIGNYTGEIQMPYKVFQHAQKSDVGEDEEDNTSSSLYGSSDEGLLRFYGHNPYRAY